MDRERDFSRARLRHHYLDARYNITVLIMMNKDVEEQLL